MTTVPTLPRRRSLVSLTCLVVLGCGGPTAAAGPAEDVGPRGSTGVGYVNPDYADQVARIDELIMEHMATVEPAIEGDLAGASIAVVHRGEVVATRGYGWADLELRVATPEDAIYEIGSVTKQFTTAALLLEQEKGTLDLDADMGTYLPDFPTQGHEIALAFPITI